MKSVIKYDKDGALHTISGNLICVKNLDGEYDYLREVDGTTYVISKYEYINELMGKIMKEFNNE